VILALAEASGASKEHEGRLAMLLNFLVDAGVVARDGSVIKAKVSQNIVPAEGAAVVAGSMSGALRRFAGIGGRMEPTDRRSVLREFLRAQTPEESKFSQLTSLFAEEMAAEPAKAAEDHAEFTFILDAKRGRRVVVTAPHDMTKKEFERVRKWMEIQLVVDDPEEPQT
jgi:hypothetical protein